MHEDENMDSNTTNVGPVPDTLLTHEPPTGPDINGVEEEGEEEELLRAPEGTPIIVNTTSGRQLILKITEDCYIAATLADDESTIGVTEKLVPWMLHMADMRFGGRKESIKRMEKLYEPEVDGN